jgi:beta-lactamase class D
MNSRELAVTYKIIVALFKLIRSIVQSNEKPVKSNHPEQKKNLVLPRYLILSCILRT